MPTPPPPICCGSGSHSANLATAALAAVLATAALAAALATAPASAQPAGSTSTAGALEEVIVTAQRQETKLQDTPIAVTAFSRSKIEDLGIFDITNISALAPNTNIRKQPSSNSNMSIFIRGVGSGETSLLVDPKVSFYIDGVYMSKTVGAVFDIVDLESVEVLRGPQGTLFGRNSTGGAINVTTVKPSGELGGRAEVSVGNDGYLRYLASVDLPQMGRLSAKLSGMHAEYDGWASNNYQGDAFNNERSAPFTSEQDLASEDNDSLRLALRLQATDELTIDYSYDQTDNEGVPAPFQVTEVKSALYNGFTTTPVPFTTIGGKLFQDMAATIGDPTERREDFTLDNVSKEKLEVKGHNLTVTWERDDFTLKYIFADRDTDSTYAGTDLDSGAYTAPNLIYLPPATEGGTPIPMMMTVPAPGFHAAIDDGWIEMTSHELQLFGDLLDGQLSYTLGLYYYDEEVLQDNPQTFSLPVSFLLRSIDAGATTAENMATEAEAVAAMDPTNTQAAEDAAKARAGATMARSNYEMLYNGYRGVGFCSATDLTMDMMVDFQDCIGYTQRLPFPASPMNPAVDLLYGQKTESWAIYGQGTWRVDNWEATVGLRYTEDDREAFLYNENLATSVPGHARANPLENDDEWDNISYLLNVRYAINDDISVYGSHSTGYNAGGFNARASSLGGWENQVDEEEIDAYELGLKAEWMERRVRTNVALFFNDYTDIQIAQFEAGSGGASSRLVNAGEAEFWGIELDMVAVLRDGLVLDATYGYLDAEFTEYTARITDPTTMMDREVDISDNTTVGRTPENTFSIGLQYDRPLAWAELSARLDANYLDEMVFHPIENQHDAAEDRWLLNARLSLNDIKLGTAGALRASLWGKNLADEEYREWGIDFSSLGFAGNVYGQPRTYGLDLVYSF